MPPGGFDKFAQHSQTSFAPNMPNISFGNAFLDQGLSMLMSGSHFAPRPGAGQSVMEAYQQRERSQKYLQAMRQSFGSSLIASKLGGIDTNSGWGSMATMLLGNPDGLMNHPLARAFNGGNPVKAHMALLANMTGMTNYMGTGVIGNASFRDTSAMMDGATRALFNTKVYGEDDVSRVRQEQNARLKSIANQSSETKDRFSDIMDSKGDIDFVALGKLKDKVEKVGIANISKLTKLTAEEYAKAIEASGFIDDVHKKIGQVVATKFNFNKSMGFELQDLTKTFTMTQDLGLFDHRKVYERKLREAGVDPNNIREDQRTLASRALGDTHEEYLKNSAGVLRAVSDLTGAETAEQSTTDLNDLLSNKYSGSASRIDVSSDAHYSEDLLRRVKSTARIAGISIDNMLGIIDQAKQLAAQHPAMNHVGGAGIIEQTLKSFNSAQTMAVYMGSAAVRQEGGLVAFTQKQIALDMENRAEPGAQFMYGLRALIQNRAMPEETRKKALAMLQDRADDPNADRTNQGRSDFRTRMAGILGMNPYQLMRIGYGETAAREGMRDAEEAMKRGERVDYKGEGQNTKYGLAKRYMGMYLADQILTRKDENAFRDKNGNKITDLDKLQANFEEKLAETRVTGKSLDSVFLEFGVDIKSMMFPGASQEEVDSVTRSFHKTAMEKRIGFKEDQLKLETLGKKSAAEESRMARRSGHLQAKFMPMLAQELISGNLSKGFEGLKEMIYTSDALFRVENIGRAAGAMNQDSSEANILASFWENRGGAQNLDPAVIAKNLKDQGSTPDEIAKILKQRQAFAGNYEAYKALDGKATLNELLAAAKDGEVGFAKSKLKQNGLAWDDVRRASDFAYHTGLASDHNKRKYGGDTLGTGLTRRMLTDEAMLKNLEIAERDWAMFDTSDAAKRVKGSLDVMLGSKDELSRKQGAAIRAAFNAAGFLRPDGSINARAIANDADKDVVSDELEGLLANEKYSKDGSPNYKAVKEALMGKSKDDVLAKLMVAGGWATTDSSGNITNLDEAKLETARLRDKAFALSSHDPTITSELDQILKYRDQTKAKIEEGTAAINGLNPDKQAAMFKSLEDTIGASSTSLSTTLATIADAMKSLITVNP